MKRILFLQSLLLAGAFQFAVAIEAPTGLVSRAGDQSIVLHWDRNTEANLSGYRLYRSITNGPFFLLTNLPAPGYCDLDTKVVNGKTNLYRVTALTTTAEESLPSATIAVTPHLFADDNEFLDYVQQTSFDYFWYLGNPSNGLVPDRTAVNSACSIAAVGFGLTAIGIGIDHGWISRTQGAARVLTTLDTFLNGPQGSNTSGVIGHKGWFYHFIEMNTAVRSPNSELSSIDTVLLLAGMLDCKQFFNGTNADETAIRTITDAIVNRVDWNWMSQGTDAVAMGWYPNSGFIPNNWEGYNEAMILYILGLGAATNPLPASAWSRWTSSYIWATHYGLSFVQFPPLFGHEYSHGWIDFRHITDDYMSSRGSTYFVNSRRATLANRAYCIANPLNRLGYSGTNWGLTASDGPTGYSARGAPPALNDDGTIAPTAAGGAMPFAPEYCVPTLRRFYAFRRSIWTAYGFRDAFNLGQQWWATDELGIDQGPIVIMIENYRTQRVWRRFMQDEVVQRGLQRAGFVSLPFVEVKAQALPVQNAIGLTWDAAAGRTYQVEYSPDLVSWFASPTGEVIATNSTASWSDSGPPDTPAMPLTVPQRFYRVFEFGSP